MSCLNAAPSILNTGSLQGASACTSNLFSHRAADGLNVEASAGI